MTPDGNITTAASCALSAKSTSFPVPVRRRFWQRWLVRDIWRAFPELDPFPDDACAALVQMTRHSAAYQCARLLGAVLTVFLAAAAAWKTALWLMTNDGFEFLHQAGLHNNATQMIGAAALLAASTAVPLLLGRLFAHALLHDRLARVLRFDGRCRQCGYSLLGLELSQTMELPCPECGHVAVVDHALAALVSNRHANGAPALKRSADASSIVCVFRPDTTWQRQRDLRLAKRALVLLGFAMIPFAAIALILGAWLWFSIRLASAAAPPPEAYRAAVQPHLHGLTLSDGCSWSKDAASIRTAWTWIYESETQNVPSYMRPTITAFDIPSRRWLGSAPRNDTSCWAPGSEQLQYRITSAALLYLFDERHASTLAPAVAAAPLQLDRGWLDPTDAAAAAHAADAADALRVTAERCESMMRLATAYGKMDLAQLALNAGLQCTTHLSCQPTPQVYERAAEISHLFAMDIVEWLTREPTEAPMDALQNAWEQHGTLRDPLLVIEWATLDHQRQVCNDLARVDVLLNSLLGPIPAGAPGGGTQRLGTIEHNVETLQQQRLSALKAAQQHAVPTEWLQPTPASNTVAPPPSILAGRFADVLPRVATAWALHCEDRHTMPVHFALARFRRAIGHYPTDLRDLVPQYLPSLPDLTTADGLARHYTLSGDRYAFSP